MNGWYQTHPNEIIALASRLPDVKLRMIFSWMLTHYLSLEGFPDDDDEIAYITGLAVEEVGLMRPYWKRLGRIEEGRIYITYAEQVITDKQMYIEQKAHAAKARWGKEREKATGAKKAKTLNTPEMQADALHKDLIAPDPSPISDEMQSNASHSDEMQSNALLCNKGMNKGMNERRNTEKEPPPPFSNSVTAKLDALEDFIVSQYGFSTIDPFLERQIRTTVGKCHAVGATVWDLEIFFAQRNKLPAINFVAQDYQTWRTSEAGRLAPAGPKLKFPPVPAGMSPGEEKRWIEEQYKMLRASQAS